MTLLILVNPLNGRSTSESGWTDTWETTLWSSAWRTLVFLPATYSASTTPCTFWSTSSITGIDASEGHWTARLSRPDDAANFKASNTQKLLLDYGADPNSKDIGDRTPLPSATTPGLVYGRIIGPQKTFPANVDMIACLLVNGAEIDSEYYEKRAPLIWAMTHIFTNTTQTLKPHCIIQFTEKKEPRIGANSQPKHTSAECRGQPWQGSIALCIEKWIGTYPPASCTVWCKYRSIPAQDMVWFGRPGSTLYSIHAEAWVLGL